MTDAPLTLANASPYVAALMIGAPLVWKFIQMVSTRYDKQTEADRKMREAEAQAERNQRELDRAEVKALNQQMFTMAQTQTQILRDQLSKKEEELAATRNLAMETSNFRKSLQENMRSITTVVVDTHTKIDHMFDSMDKCPVVAEARRREQVELSR